MRYCPSCKKPSASENRACPHCGANFSGRAPTPVPPDTAAFEDDGERLLTLGDDGPELALELADTAPPARRVDAALGAFETQEITDADVRELAGFGRPDPGVLGTLRYAMRVRKRLRELTPASRQATETAEMREGRLREALAALGREAARHNLVPERAGTHLLDEALAADERVATTEADARALQADHDEKNAQLAAQMAELTQRVTPLRQAERDAQQALEAAHTEMRRARAMHQRTEIELRNIRTKIEEHQRVYADLQQPKAERQRHLNAISELDGAQQPLLSRLSQQQSELNAREEAHRQQAQSWEAAQSRLADEEAHVTACQQAQAQLSQSHQDALLGLQSQMSEKNAEVTLAWSAVGEAVLAAGELREHAALSEWARTVAQQQRAFLAAQRQQALHHRALVAFDAARYAQAKRYAIAALFLFVALVVGILVALL